MSADCYPRYARSSLRSLCGSRHQWATPPLASPGHPLSRARRNHLHAWIRALHEGLGHSHHCRFGERGCDVLGLCSWSRPPTFGRWHYSVCRDGHSIYLGPLQSRRNLQPRSSAHCNRRSNWATIVGEGIHRYWRFSSILPTALFTISYRTGALLVLSPADGSSICTSSPTACSLGFSGRIDTDPSTGYVVVEASDVDDYSLADSRHVCLFQWADNALTFVHRAAVGKAIRRSRWYSEDCPVQYTIVPRRPGETQSHLIVSRHKMQGSRNQEDAQGVAFTVVTGPDGSTVPVTRHDLCVSAVERETAHREANVDDSLVVHDSSREWSKPGSRPALARKDLQHQLVRARTLPVMLPSSEAGRDVQMRLPASSVSHQNRSFPPLDPCS